MLYQTIISEIPWNFVAVADDEKLYCLDLYPSNLAMSFNAVNGNNKILERCKEFLDCYFQGLPLPPIPPLAPATSAFAQAVRDAVLTIKPGERITYKGLAERMVNYCINPTTICRALGHALHLNPFLLMVPCHRVVKSSGSPGAYRAGADLKIFLLDFERRHPQLAE